MEATDKSTGQAKQAVGDESLRRDGAHLDPNPATARTERAWGRLLLFAVLAAVGFFAAVVLKGAWQMVGAGVASLAVIAWAVSFAKVLASAERTVTARTRATPRPPVAARISRFRGSAKVPRSLFGNRTTRTTHGTTKTDA